jgi:hypothetical protein
MTGGVSLLEIHPLQQLLSARARNGLPYLDHCQTNSEPRRAGELDGALEDPDNPTKGATKYHTSDFDECAFCGHSD